MKYLCLIYLQEAAMEALPQREWDALLDACDTCVEVLQRDGRYLAGEILQPVYTATTARVRNGRLSTTDGPFAETREQLAGFCLIDADDTEQALALAAAMPPARYGCVEVRPVRAPVQG